MKKLLLVVCLFMASCAKEEKTVLYVDIVGETSVAIENKSGDIILSESDSIPCNVGEKVKYDISGDDVLVRFWYEGAIIEEVWTDSDPKSGKFRVKL